MDNAKLMDGLKRYTKGFEKTYEMMMHQALIGNLKGFDEAIKKHKVERKNKPHMPPQ